MTCGGHSTQSQTAETVALVHKPSPTTLATQGYNRQGKRLSRGPASAQHRRRRPSMLISQRRRRDVALQFRVHLVYGTDHGPWFIMGWFTCVAVRKFTSRDNILERNSLNYNYYNRILLAGLGVVRLPVGRCGRGRLLWLFWVFSSMACRGMELAPSLCPSTHRPHHRRVMHRRRRRCHNSPCCWVVSEGGRKQIF